jgi:23S rRNA (uridine2552-2'-O)-methyltransferase
LIKVWLEKRKRDYYYRKAKEEKYRSRAAYKLLQAADKYRFIQKGDVVVDLGAAPGGWLQASRKLVGTKGFVLGVDLKPIEPLPEENVQTLIGDITNKSLAEKITALLPRKADVVLCDASPNISGVWEVDHAKQIDLAMHALYLAEKILKTKGNFFVKVFQGDMLDDYISKMKRRFSKFKLIKPPASRAESSEIFLLGIGWNG